MSYESVVARKAEMSHWEISTSSSRDQINVAKSNCRQIDNPRGLGDIAEYAPETPPLTLSRPTILYCWHNFLPRTDLKTSVSYLETVRFETFAPKKYTRTVRIQTKRHHCALVLENGWHFEDWRTCILLVPYGVLRIQNIENQNHRSNKVIQHRRKQKRTKHLVNA